LGAFCYSPAAASSRSGATGVIYCQISSLYSYDYNTKTSERELIEMPILQIAAGFAVGWLSALLGIGGGVILIPLMIYFFKVPIQQAVGTSLAVIIPTALVGAWKHYNLNHLNIKLAVLLAVGAVIGAYIGALSVNLISPVLLRKFFAVLLVITAVRMFIS
jgi:uncharacterized membrane protein YfcA